MDSAPAAVPEFIKACPQVLERVTPNQMERWFEEGVRVLGQNSEGGLAYFKIESSHSEEVLETLSSGVEFGRHQDRDGDVLPRPGGGRTSICRSPRS